MFMSYDGSLLMHTRQYELTLCTFSCRNSREVTGLGEKYDERDTVRLCRVAVREIAMELGYCLTSFRAPTQQNLKIAGRVAAYNDGDMGTVARIDESDKKRRKSKINDRKVSTYHAVYPSHRL